MDPVKPAGNCPVDLPLGLETERAAFEAWVATQPGHPFAGVYTTLMRKAWNAAVAAERERCAVQQGRFAGWFREIPSAMSYRLWQQGGHEQGPDDVALYEA